jgi:thioredoxin reductase
MEIPPLSPSFESSVPGIFIAGELGGMGLIRKAAEQGRQAIDGIKARCEADARRAAEFDIDVLIVGCGPAGLSAGLAAKAHGLRYRLIEQEEALGGTVFHYPRHKIAMTAPVELAIIGKVRFGEVRKEKLLAFWQQVVARTQLQIHFSERMDDVMPLDGGGFLVRTSQGERRARTVLLAMGRRGTPRKLGVPGESQPKVVYGLSDAAQYTGQAVLVVGGGDSALEAAIALSQERGTEVTLSYRSAAFSRVKTKNRLALEAARKQGRVQVLMESSVQRIGEQDVHLDVGHGAVRTLRNDAVIVCAGGLPPTPLLQKIGIQFVTKHGEA